MEPLAAEIGAVMVGHCDVSDESTIDAVFENVEKLWGKIDFIVHAIGFSDKDELTGRYVDTTPDNFAKTMQISVYSFTSVARRAEKLRRAADRPVMEEHSARSPATRAVAANG